MIQNEVLKKDRPCGIMEAPQMSRPAWKEFMNEQQAEWPDGVYR
jgi:hypothetical protein